MKIIEEPKQNSIPVSEMKDGELAVITDWHGGYHIGRIIQRFGGNLITVGMSFENGWGSFFKYINGSFHDCRVRILPKGTKLEI